MSLPKLLDLLANRHIVIGKLDNFEDDFEGRYPITEVQQQSAPDDPDDSFHEVLRLHESMVRPRTYISCWSEAPTESSVMWGLFAAQGLGVVLTTTIGSLTAAISDEFPHEIYLGAVRYTNDLEDLCEPGMNACIPIFAKRTWFEAEREIRLAVLSMAIDEAGQLERPEMLPPVMSVPIDLHSLDFEIRVQPRAAGWQVDAVRRTVEALGHEASVVDSSIFDRKKAGIFL